MSPGAALLSALQEGSFASAMRDSIWLYPLIEIIHIFGFAILVGAVVMFDLRVLGISKRISVRLLARHLLPWSLAALLLHAAASILIWAGVVACGRMIAYV